MMEQPSSVGSLTEELHDDMVQNQGFIGDEGPHSEGGRSWYH